MECNCIKESEQEVLKMLREKHPERTYEDIEHFGDLGYENVGFSFSESSFFSFPFKARYTFVKTNGELSKPKAGIINMRGAYCPFCGIKKNEA